MVFPGNIVRIISKFPLLTSNNWRLTSPATNEYNCIAWAAHDAERWWWPDMDGDAFWPSEVSRQVTLDAFVAAYGLVGYSICATGHLEDGFEKIAIYAKPTGPTHAARQLASGKWTSKLGGWEDIEHDSPAALVGEIYGDIVCFLKRKL
jgi:hypothetical protein